MASNLLQGLASQAENLPVEVLAFYDNKKRSVGEKRNSLLREARGDYVVYLDDDDRVEPDYLAVLVATIAANPGVDCIVYDQLCTRPRKEPLLCKYGIELEYNNVQKGLWTGKPAHTMPWRRELVKNVAFGDSNFGEDTDWVKRAVLAARTQVRIERVMYYYQFDPEVSRTRGRGEPVEVVPELTVPTSLYRAHTVDCSVVIATHNKPVELERSLASIFKQQPEFRYEVIVIDDGSAGDATERVCLEFESAGHLVRYFRLENNTYRNPCFARNYGYKQALGRVLVLQSDDVMHVSDGSLTRLMQIEPGTFNIATVWNAKIDVRGTKIAGDRNIVTGCYTGVKNPRPLFFLGSMLRDHCYAIGGNCEEFTEPGYEDDWFGKCLMHGLGLKPVFREDVVAYHQHHERPPTSDAYARMREVYNRKYAAASAGLEKWVGGDPWPITTTTTDTP
jgi:glycosyltransferase involved in cell wall biosynthesis